MMQNAASLLVVAATLLPVLAVPTQSNGTVWVHNACDFPIWINDVAPSVNQWDAWSQVAPSHWFKAANTPSPNTAGMTEKIGLQRGTNDILQLEVAMAAGGTFHYDMSSVNGNPFDNVGRRIGCMPNWQEHDSQFCGPYETKFPCGKHKAGEPFRVMSAPSACSNIFLELCAK